MQRRQLVEARATGSAPAAPRRRPACPGRAGVDRARSPVDRRRCRPRGDEGGRGSRPTNDQRLQRSPCSTDSSRKPGSSSRHSRAKAATGVIRSASSSRQTGTTVYVGGQRVELGRGRAAPRTRSRRVRTRARRTGRSRSGCRCGRRRCPPARPRTAACRRRSRRRPRGCTGGRRRSRPCTSTPGGDRLQNQVRPVSSERRSDSSFIQAIISTVAGAVLLHDGGHQAVGVEGDRGELLVGERDGGGDRHGPVIVEVGPPAEPIATNADCRTPS